ncbi:hypothetical protein KW792_01435, partial [Candidatus Saccharibacteria bacterium]|nr:hypothetical protein [Candidatus Saccharibacteria bacterium]
MLSSETENHIAIGFPGQGSQNPGQIKRLLSEHPIALDVILEGETALERPLLPLLLGETTLL